MTGFRSCITDKAAEHGLSPEQAAEAQEAYDAAFETAAQTHGPAEADRVAGQAVVDGLDRAAQRARRNTALGVKARRAALEAAADFKRTRGYTGVTALGGGKGSKPPKGGWTQGGKPPAEGPYARGGMMAAWLKELVDGSGGVAGSAGASINGRYRAVRGQFDAMMADVAEKFDSSLGTGHRNRATLDNLVRAAFGEDTGDGAASTLAKAWGETADHARKLFNAAGGDIGKLEGWGLPQSHDGFAVRKAGREAWVADILPRLDAGRMIDKATGLPFNPGRLKAVLGEVYQTIVTSDAINREAGEALGVGAVSSQRQDHRFLIFRDADHWLAYAGQFGVADPYAAMVRHLDGMARDIARMQVLGPNPDHQFEWLATAAQREADIEQGLDARERKGVFQADGMIDSARKMYGLFTGELSGPYGSNNMVAKVGAAVRAGLSGVQLGSAVLNDIASNPVIAAQVRAFSGLSKGGDFQALAGHLLSPAVRQRGRRTGFIYESTRATYAGAVQDFLRAGTVGGKIAEGGNAVARLLPNYVHRASFLEAGTRAQRESFQHEFMGAVFDRKGMTVAGMAADKDPELREFARTLRSRGFTEAEWKAIASTPPESPAPGADFVSPMAVARAHGDELAFRYAEMIDREQRAAVPEPSLWARAQLTAGTRPGTVQGEIVRSAASYRSFSVTQSYQWAREYELRAWQGYEAAGRQGAPVAVRLAILAAPALIALTVSGGLVVLTKDVVKGNDPRRATTPQFWAAALAQGGGQGILGDFLFSAQSRAGKSSAMTGWGPAGGFVSDTFDLTVGNLGEIGDALTDGADLGAAIDKAHPGRDAATYMARYNPLASLWWTRTAWNRLVLDNIQRLLDPEADEAFERQRARLERDFGQGQWWPEGAQAPDRAPDMGAVFEPGQAAP